MKNAFPIFAMLLSASCLAGGCQFFPNVTAPPMTYLASPGLTQEDLLLHFGTPTGRFEDDRILTWRIGQTDNGTLGPASRATLTYGDDDDWQNTSYDLVAVFDQHRRLQRYRLIPVQRK